jgi:hypothetical protein
LEPAKMDFTQSMFLFSLVEEPKKLERLVGRVDASRKARESWALEAPEATQATRKAA